MTNETTASQPKSIGDDAQFMTILNEANYTASEASVCGNDFGTGDKAQAAEDALITYIDSRAPAAQASATIQAAPELVQASRKLIHHLDARAGRPVEFTYSDPLIFAIRTALVAIERAATIQEPVMVAEPVTYLRWWARQIGEGHGNIGHEEGYEECKPGELSDDGSLAFPVYAAPMVADPVVWQFREMRDSAWQGWVPCDKSTYDLFIADPEPNAQVRALGVIGAAPMVADPAGVDTQWPPMPDPIEARDHGHGLYSFDQVQTYARAAVDLAATVKAVPSEALDTKLLDALGNESWNLECFDMPTGGDDSDIGWRVVGHHMAEPIRRIVAEVYEDNPRAAIKAALAAPLADKTGGAQ